MKPLTAQEFKAMEQLLADLLQHCDPAEELALLGLYTRLEAIWAKQQSSSEARNKLKKLQSQNQR